MQNFLDIYFQTSAQPNMTYNVYLVTYLVLVWSGRLTSNRLAQAGLTLAAPFLYGFVAMAVGERTRIRLQQSMSDS